MPENNKEQNQKEIISPSYKVFFWEAFLFCLTLGLGIAAAFKINKILEFEKIVLPQISFWKFILYFLFATLFIFLISHFVKFKKGKGIFFKAIFILATFGGGFLLLNCWIPGLPALILMVSLAFWWLKRPSVLNQDLCIILGIAGIGSSLGLSLIPLMVIALLLIFSIYDFIAVYKTKHMVKMTKEMIESKAILALVVPPDFSDFKESLEKIQPGGKFLILGGGDIVFPLLFCASLIPSPFGIFNSLVVAIFSLIGLFIGFWFFTSQKTRKPIPALPPIAFFSIIGFLITKLF